MNGTTQFVTRVVHTRLDPMLHQGYDLGRFVAVTELTITIVDDTNQTDTVELTGKVRRIGPDFAVTGPERQLLAGLTASVDPRSTQVPSWLKQAIDSAMASHRRARLHGWGLDVPTTPTEGPTP